MNRNFVFLAIGLFVILLLMGCNSNTKTKVQIEGDELKKFNSAEEMHEFIKQKTIQQPTSSLWEGVLPSLFSSSSPLPSIAADTKVSVPSYSTTNIQVAGVDEADRVKTDGNYIYTITGNKIAIAKAWPADEAELVSEINPGAIGSVESLPGIFVKDDKLVAFALVSQFGSESYTYTYKTMILQYDISDRFRPRLERKVSIEGHYLSARLIENNIYVISNKYVDYARPTLPTIEYDNDRAGRKEREFPGVYYFDEPSPSYSFTSVISFDLTQKAKKPKSKIFLTGSTETVYVSKDNIYLSSRFYRPLTVKRSVMPVPVAFSDMIVVREPNDEDTISISKISIKNKNGEIEFVARGFISGHLLNQFSMDEYNGYLRVATTKGYAQRSQSAERISKNNVYTLDSEMNVAGKLEGLALGEQIYSARFIGDRAYLVTFKKVDPLFVIDLKNPERPKLLGKLKIPGYSDYLHPYDENHLIGIGKSTVEAGEGEGNFAWYQGVKLSLFDVTNVSRPKEIAKYEIGDRGTDSYALHDHHAFLFSKEKNLLVIPILLAEKGEKTEIETETEIGGREVRERLSPSSRAWEQGDYTFQGAYIFDLTKEKGFRLRGRITHLDLEDNEELMRAGYYYYSSLPAVKRSLYIGDNLYTISDKKIKINKLDRSLSAIKNVDLPFSEPEAIKYYD